MSSIFHHLARKIPSFIGPKPTVHMIQASSTRANVILYSCLADLVGQEDSVCFSGKFPGWSTLW